MRSLLALFVAALVASCATTSTPLSSPPSALAPLEVRAAFYEEHAPTSIRVQPPAAAWVRGGLRAATLTSSFIVLQNGTRVDEAVALLPLVKPSSPTARAAENAAEHRARAQTWSTLASVVGASGCVLQATTAFLGLLSYPPVEGGARVDPTLMMLGNVTGLALLGVAGGAVLVSFNDAEHARRDEATALLAFDMSLRDRLGLARRKASAFDDPAQDSE